MAAETELLLEAHAPADFHAKVTSLHQGEVARLQGGVAVKRVALEDGRDAFKVGRTPSWRGAGEPAFDSYDTHRTPEDATRAAFKESAASTDPESLGGKERLTRFAPLLHGGSEVKIHDFTTDGKLLVGPPGAPAQTRAVDPSSLARKNVLLESAETAMLSKRHAPIGKGGSNWITRSKPGNTGQLPAYIQNVRNGIMKGGTEESRATAIAIGKVEDWAAGKGNVGPEVKAAAAKAVAELRAMQAKTKAGKVAESDDAFWLTPLQEAPYGEASRAAALAARKAKHPDWNWGGSAPSHETVEPGHILKDRAGGHFKVEKKTPAGIHVALQQTNPGNPKPNPGNSTAFRTADGVTGTSKTHFIKKEKIGTTFVDHAKPPAMSANGHPVAAGDHVETSVLKGRVARTYSGADGKPWAEVHKGDGTRHSAPVAEMHKLESSTSGGLTRVGGRLPRRKG